VDEQNHRNSSIEATITFLKDFSWWFYCSGIRLIMQSSIMSDKKEGIFESDSMNMDFSTLIR